jgi:REP element-mobilizing transposase RayT
MKKFQNKYRIPSSRAQWWNYGNDGVYFITICTAHRECYFGEIVMSDVETPNLGVSTATTSVTGIGTNSVMVLSELGKIVQKYWLEIPDYFSYVILDAFMVMPNHFHGIVIIDKPENTNNMVVPVTPDVETPKLGVSTTIAPPPTQKESVKCGGKNEKWYEGVLGVVMNQFKRKCTIECRKFNPDFGWQSRFYDSIIRDQESYNAISYYIRNNLSKWKVDIFHPDK